MQRQQRKRHRRSKKSRFLALGILFAMAVIALWITIDHPNRKAADVWYDARVTDKQAIAFPAADAPHDTHYERWYYTGFLQTESGDNFSFQYGVFLSERLAKHWDVQAALLDHQTGRYSTQQFSLQTNEEVNPDDGFKFRFKDWRMSGVNGRDRIKVTGDDFAFNLSLKYLSQPILHGDKGRLDLDSIGAVYAYSRPRMSASGFVESTDTLKYAKGWVWFYHQWGDIRSSSLEWDWFGLQLSDKTEVMLYVLRDNGGERIAYSGTVLKNGVSEVLSASDFFLETDGSWTSTETGISYPQRWHLSIPKQGIDLMLLPKNLNGEFDARKTTYNVFWRGIVDVTGSHTGLGFVELSGYAISGS